MSSKLPKALHQLTGVTLIENILKTLQNTSVKNILIVGSSMLFEHPEWIRIRHEIYPQSTINIQEILQNPPLGTGHAIQTSFPYISKKNSKIIICHADMPFIQEETFEILLNSSSDLTLSIIKLDNPKESSFGRVILKNNQPIDIIEAKDATPEQKSIPLANAAVYAISQNCLENCLFDLKNDNNAQEFYFTDIIRIAVQKGFSTSYYEISAEEAYGIDTPQNLIQAPIQEFLRQKMIRRGVIFQDPQSVILSLDTQIGRNTFIGAFNVFGPNVTIGASATIHPFCVLNNCIIEENCIIGPFAHIKEKSHIYSHATVGNFVEIKKSTLGAYTKAKHLSYIGDAQFGKKVNVGAGTIVCNYDGFQKHPTFVENNASIGANSSLVAPLHIGKSSVIGAGSVITKNVPDETLAISRPQQIHNSTWVSKRKSKQVNHK